MELYLSDFPFPQFLNSIVAIVRIRAEQKNIAFHYEKLSELPNWVRGDEKRLRQVLINLLGNAVKFTETGGVTFKVGYLTSQELKAESPNLEPETLEQSAQKMRFVVEDTGIGMAPEQMAEIFLPFHQIGDSCRQVEGTGLGLAISQRLVQLLGGTMGVKSTLREGSVFWLDLDLPEVLEWQEITAANEKAIIGFRGNKCKVLVADDKWENRSVLANLLLPLGFEVIEATDGQDCLNQALKIKPDVILLDLMMPGMDGLEATRQIRRLPKLKELVVIATSASVFADHQQECLAAGCNGFIPQPVQTENLFKQLQVHLGLEWIYEEAKGIETLPAASLCSFVAPPPSEMAALYELAMMGDIQGITEQAQKLEQLDEQFVPLAKHLYQLAQTFQEKQILELVKRYMVVKE